MDPVQFAIWRFRHAEGVMANVTKWDLNSCIINVDNKEILIVYDTTNNRITIKRNNDPFAASITCTFDEFQDQMKALGFYEERPANERHSLSYESKKI